MANDDWKYKELPKAAGETAPAVWNPKENKWEVYTGSTNVVELENKLETIEEQQKQILERLDGEFDTRLTGSNVEQDVNVKNYPDTQKVEVTNQQEIPSVEFPSDYPDSKASERLGVIEQQQAKILDRLNNEEGLPI